MNPQFSPYGQRITGSLIDHIMDATAEPEEGTIQLSIGTPHLDHVPLEALTTLTQTLMKERIPSMFGYGSVAGYSSLRRFLASRYHVEEANIMVTHGATQGYDLVTRVLLDQTKTIVTERATYSIGFSMPQHHGTRVHAVEMEEDGLCVDEVEAFVQHTHIAYVYVIPNAQNPTGITLSLEKRKQLVDLSYAYDFLIIEDDPYRELMFEGEHIPSLYELDTANERVIYLGSFSKIITPGYRVGFLFAPLWLMETLGYAKQSSDCSTNPFAQAVIASFCESHMLDMHVHSLKQAYRQKRDVMLESLTTHFSSINGCSWTKPAGGMFLTLTLPGVNTTDLLSYAIEEKVMFLPGEAFDPYGTHQSYLRLCFASATHDNIEQGIKRLATAVTRIQEKN